MPDGCDERGVDSFAEPGTMAGMENTVMRGWRYFRCESCELTYREPSRDCGSPSGIACDSCGDWLTPEDAQPDASLPFDEQTGNLNIPSRVERL
jgi:hypothetical protein